MYHQEKTHEIAEWYAEQIMQNFECPYDEIEWLVKNLESSAFQQVQEIYYIYNEL